MKADATKSRLSWLGLAERPVRILSVGSTGVSEDLGGGRIDWAFARAAAEVMVALRGEPFDHVLAGRTVGREAVWPLIRRIRMVRRGQRWSLVASSLSEAEEVLARSLGVMRIFASPPDWEGILELVAGSMAAREAGREEETIPARSFSRNFVGNPF